MEELVWVEYDPDAGLYFVPGIPPDDELINQYPKYFKLIPKHLADALDSANKAAAYISDLVGDCND